MCLCMGVCECMCVREDRERERLGDIIHQIDFLISLFFLLFSLATNPGKSED